MLFYTHLVWSLDLLDFFGPGGWLPQFPISHFYLFSSPTLIWIAHLAALAVFFCLMIGFHARTASVLAALLTLSYINQVPMATFGLDQINAMLAVYLVIGPSGAWLSVDHWRTRRAEQGEAASDPRASVSANVAIRLIQLHMCVIYFFAGSSKLLGAAWWDGTALWWAMANSEYKTIDMFWLADWPRLVSVLSQVTVLWELSFAALIWPKLTRPPMLILAVLLHLGIGICLGMMTFGLVMLIGCSAFLPAAWVRHVFRDTPAREPQA